MRKYHLINNLLNKPALLAGAIIMLLVLFLPMQAMAVGEDCTVSVLNRTATVQPNGTWRLRNVPSGLGQVRARMTCVVNGKTISGQSDYFTVSSNGAIDVGDIFFFNEFKEVPNALSLTSPTTTMTAIGATTQLTVTATYPSTATANVTAGVNGTTYRTTNPAIAAVSADGLVTAIGTGKVIISASNEMVLSSVLISVVQANNPDSDGDGLPDAWEIANGLNPNDPVDALKDPDGDGLTNLDEYNYGTQILNPDTDGDGINDGEEVIPDLVLGTPDLVLGTPYLIIDISFSLFNINHGQNCTHRSAGLSSSYYTARQSPTGDLF